MTALKRLVKDLETLPEELRGFYVESDEGFVLETDDGDYKSRLDEFRTNNITLKQSQEELQKQMEQYKGIDPENYQRAMGALEKIEQDEDRKLLEEGKLEDVVARRTEAMRADYERQHQMAKKQATDAHTQAEVYQRKLAQLTINQAITDAIGTAGLQVQAGAMEDIQRRTRNIYKVNDKGETVPTDANGGIIFGKDSEPMKMEEWMSRLTEEAGHLFVGSTGGGAGGGERSSVPSGRVIDGSDPMIVGRNLEDIAKGKIQVR